MLQIFSLGLLIFCHASVSFNVVEFINILKLHLEFSFFIRKHFFRSWAVLGLGFHASQWLKCLPFVRHRKETCFPLPKGGRGRGPGQSNLFFIYFLPRSSTSLLLYQGAMIRDGHLAFTGEEASPGRVAASFILSQLEGQGPRAALGLHLGFESDIHHTKFMNKFTQVFF